jgi:hypothetical protein
MPLYSFEVFQAIALAILKKQYNVGCSARPVFYLLIKNRQHYAAGSIY